ncbi:MAG TPA: ATP-binding protein [Gammaproteobacteria bacterium]|nr:ATP-binding protein [Gammaproteobacteria bacterium]
MNELPALPLGYTYPANHNPLTDSRPPPREPIRLWSRAARGNRIAVAAMNDIVTARQYGGELARKCGFSSNDTIIIVTIISELARNIVLYAGRGDITVSLNASDERCGISIVGRDEGPGIADTERATAGGYSTSGGLGLGLAGVRGMADDFRIDSRPGGGTVVTVEKWLP